MRDALLSSKSLVVVEAPAGCGKTFAGAECAHDFVSKLSRGRILVLTHTHAAADVFARRVKSNLQRVEVRTIDSFIHEIASTYHQVLGLPVDIAAWARANDDGYGDVATKVAGLVSWRQAIGRALACRYPAVICDEHQDSTHAQEAIVRAMMNNGSLTRIFGDPMQGIYRDPTASLGERWQRLLRDADDHFELETPHRWSGGSEALGQWVLSARNNLKQGRSIDLRNAPTGVRVIRADYSEPRRGTLQFDRRHAPQVWSQIDNPAPLLVLSPHNKTVEGIRSYFARRLTIWEGHTRDKLDKLVREVEDANRDSMLVCDAFIKFLTSVATGFSESRYGKRLRREVAEECSGTARGELPPALQAVGRCIIASADHIGISNALREIRANPAFSRIKVDYPREYRDAIRLGNFAVAEDGLAEMARRRNFARANMPARAVSTIHKAKGLEFERVLVLPCDEKYFADSEKSRRLLYVAISRATRSLTIVIPFEKPSALFCTRY